MPFKSADVEEVLVQGAHMSGDRNSIATALKLKAKLGVLIIYSPSLRVQGLELENFYKSIVDASRVASIQIIHSSDPSLAAGEKCMKDVYRLVSSRDFKNLPGFMKTMIPFPIRMCSATFGTGVIADAFQKDAGSTRNSTRDLWRLDKVPKKTGPGVIDKRPDVRKFLTDRGFLQKRAYVFLFAKEGPRRAEKAHHFTSILTWRMLHEEIGRSSSVIPVAAGDYIGLRTLPTLAEFWKDADWTQLWTDVTVDPRSAQLGLWCLLAEEYTGVSIIGMRSGMIEVPALLGIRTLYLEEKLNQQAERMAKWIGKVPGFERQVVEKPAGIKQQLYWRDESAKRYQPSTVSNHAASNSAHLAGMVQGFRLGRPFRGRTKFTPAPVLNEPQRKPTEARTRPQPTLLANTRLPAPIDAANLQLAKSEFDRIVTWAKATPVPTGATTSVHGSVARVVEVQEPQEAPKSATNL
ncbi:hypothetical protein ACSFBF_23040 [Variovorax sp. ZT5P49]|uniref:hypothetical protein n=1 Tax=Variovorax sp. ZT5P49 TaxID=3443733 RepID=UPI003F456A8A